jgi:hypothetical protein
MKRELRKALRDSRTYKQSEDDLISTIEDLYAEEIGSLKSKIKELERRLPKLLTDLAEELWNHYPSNLSVMIDGVYPLAKGAKNRDQMLEAYCKAIDNNLETHKRIMSLVTWGVNNKEIRYGISSFIINRDWTRLEALKLSAKVNDRMI